MLLLLLKLMLAPLLVAGGSAAQRRWGQAVGGRLVGLPLTSVPLLFILVLAQGATFAAGAAAASLAGVTGQAVLTWTYARVAPRHGPVPTVLAAVASFALAAVALAVLSPTPVVAAVAGVITLGALLWYWPSSSRPTDVATAPQPGRPSRGGAEPGDADAGRSTIGLRMVLASAFSFVVSELASPLGPHLAGLITALPVLSLVMFALTQHDDGVTAAQEFSHGVERGSFSVIAALLVLALGLPTGHVMVAFGAAIAASVLTQLVGSLAEHQAAEHQAAEHQAAEHQAAEHQAAEHQAAEHHAAVAVRPAVAVHSGDAPPEGPVDLEPVAGATRTAWVGSIHVRAHPPKRYHPSRRSQRGPAGSRSRSRPDRRGGGCRRQLDP